MRHHALAKQHEIRARQLVCAHLHPEEMGLIFALFYEVEHESARPESTFNNQ